ncbi:glycoside hydrolase family 43 protein [Herbiconiux ginsengi]|uniref:Beta-xylosidase n=1 Tax=Herbiconiux ginsengi TaxID=381665 RepID=A0A1H3L8L6_9MICO|nr:glycoside hydrolase family 43 protein [Herbiconiux ginsengi]SDY60626.1 Beta-xylosidase [Herbiconiux ginsengi]
MTLPNPLLPGFNPDPSVVRVGDDFYLATSTFEYLPGVPIYHSRDFVTWTQVGAVATRVGQLAVEDTPTAGGAWAPTIRYRDGLFHLVITDAFGRGTLHFTAERAEGPWSDGMVFDGIDGIDPDLVWDDEGNAYLTFSGLRVNPALPTFMQHRGLLQAKVDLVEARALETPRSIWSGVGGQFPEAPHLYHIGDWWYLVIAEGGTERGHGVSVARAHSPEGPFEAAAGNPLLTARGTDRPIQNTGHGDLVLGPDGEWLLVLLGVRPRSMTRAFSALGRETFVTTVEWADGWPSFEPVQLTPREGVVSFRDDFDAPELDPAWMAVRRTPESTCALSGGSLVVRADGSTLSDLVPAFVGRRQLHQTASVRARVDVSAGAGGLAVRYDERFHYSIVAGAGQIVARGAIPSFERVVGLPYEEAIVELEIRSRRPDGEAFEARTSDVIELAAVVDGRRTVLLELDGRYLSSETAESFTGRVVGLVALEGSIAVEWFDYEGTDA